MEEDHAPTLERAPTMGEYDDFMRTRVLAETQIDAERVEAHNLMLNHGARYVFTSEGKRAMLVTRSCGCKGAGELLIDIRPTGSQLFVFDQAIVMASSTDRIDLYEKAGWRLTPISEWFDVHWKDIDTMAAMSAFSALPCEGTIH